MILGLYYDTETTGLPLFREPSDDPRQPHIVELAATLVDMDSRRVVAAMHSIVKPSDWEIPQEVSDIHGITQEFASAAGDVEPNVLVQFFNLWHRASVRIAHNEQFDARIIRIASKRFIPDMADPWKEGAAECTARMATPICALPPTEKMRAAKRFHHKTPNLGEAHRILCGEDFDGAHSAQADVNACIRVHWAIKDLDAKVAANA